jgi:cysteine desulfurase/selenocysteine lyase
MVGGWREEKRKSPVVSETTSIYLNNAATTWPKPEIVYQTVDDCFRHLASPGRSAGMSGSEGTAIMQAARQEIAAFFNLPDPTQLVFMPSCTYALNLAILCQDWQPGDQIVMSGMEHHAVSRPVRKVARDHKVEFFTAPYQPTQPFDLNFLEERLKGGKVKFVACSMASNLTGDIMPVHEIGKLCRQYGARFLVDAAQAAGLLPVDVQAIGADFLAFAGHKGLFGPPGIGGLYVAPGIVLKTLAEGGTGKDSGQHEMSGRFPSNFEVGTHNLLGICGVTAGVRWINQVTLEAIRAREQALTTRFVERLQHVPELKLFGNPDLSKRTAVVSLTCVGGVSPHQLADWLANEHGVVTRSGYHCAPLAHETIGTLPGEGTIRFSFGYHNTEQEADHVADLVKQFVTQSVNASAAAH